MSAKRYDADVKYIGTGDYVPVMTETDDGEYVRHEDFAALEAKCERMAKCIESAVRIKYSLKNIVALVNGESPSLFEDSRDLPYDMEAEQRIAAFDAARAAVEEGGK